MNTQTDIPRAAWLAAAQQVGKHIQDCPACRARPPLDCPEYDARIAAERAAWDARDGSPR